MSNKVLFQDMEYSRLSLDELKETIENYTKSFKEAASFEEADRIFIETDDYFKHLSTKVELASIHHSIDTRDKYWEEEKNYWDELLPSLQEINNKWQEAFLNSRFAKEFEEKYGNVLFLNGKIELRSFKPELVPCMQEENKLVTEYEKLLASAQIPFNGKTYTLSQITPLKSDADDEVRLAAWKAEGQWYKDNQEALDELYSIPGKVPNPINMPNYCYFKDRCDKCVEACNGEYPCEISLSETHKVSCYRYYDHKEDK